MHSTDLKEIRKTLEKILKDNPDLYAFNTGNTLEEAIEDITVHIEWAEENEIEELVDQASPEFI